MTHTHELSKYLKEMRLAKGLSLAELALQLKVPTQFVSQWERGVCAPPGVNFKELISILGLEKEKLVEALLADSKSDILRFQQINSESLELS